MRKYYILSMVIVLALPALPAAQDIKNKVTIYNFVNKTEVVTTAKAAKGKKPRNDDSLYLIVPLTLSKEFTANGRWEVTKSNETINAVEQDNATYAEYVNSLKLVSDTINADYLVAGMYRIEGKKLIIEAHLYVSRLRQIIKVNVSSDAGAIIADVVGELSDRINAAMDTYLSKLTPPPVFNPPSTRFNNTGTVAIEVKSKNTTIYYTTNGSDPVPNTRKTYIYTKPLVINRDAEIRALAQRKDFSPSQIVTESYRIRTRYSVFEVDVFFGSPVFMGSWGNKMNNGGSDWFQIRGAVDFYSFNALSRIPVVKDMTLILSSDLGSSSQSFSSSMKTGYAFYTGAASLAYKLRFGTFFEVEPSIGAGAAYVRLTDKELHFPSFVYSPGTKTSSSKKFMYTGSVIAGIALGDWRILTGVNYKTIQLSGDPMKILVYQIGFGYRF